jgi:hypothetical protein
VERISASQPMEYASTLGWPPGEASIPSTTSTTKARTEDITTPLGTFRALRVDTFQEYRVQTMNHSDPSGTVKRTEWYVCGVGLIRASMDHDGMYQARPFERQSELELLSFAPLP